VQFLRGGPAETRRSSIACSVPPTSTGATHLLWRLRCHPPFSVPPTATVPPTQFGQRAGYAVSYGDAFCNTRCLAPHAGTSCSDVVQTLLVTHLPVPSTFAGATHPNRPASRMCGFLASDSSTNPTPGAGGTPAGATHRLRCHPSLPVPSTFSLTYPRRRHPP